MKPSPVTPLIVGVDASRNRSGGAKAHLIGILNAVNPRDFNIDHVHVWTHRRLAESLPERPWLTLHSPAELAGSLGRQLRWQRFSFPGELERAGCAVLLTTDAGSICTWGPAVVMSRDMLSFEPREMSRFRFRPAWLRLAALRVVQVQSLRRAAGTLFLTQYAARVCQQYTGKLNRVRVIPHGIADEFRLSNLSAGRKEGGRIACRCLYVSNFDLYKHQWHVVAAMGQLLREGYDVTLTLVGGGGGSPRRMLDAELAKLGDLRSRIEVIEAVPHHEIPRYLASADVFIFASSCENMPNTLVEAMAAGLPIACSDRGPMPEVLQDGGVFFDPEEPATIVKAVRTLLDSAEVRAGLAKRAKSLSEAYSWRRCAAETWAYLREVAKESVLL